MFGAYLATSRAWRLDYRTTLRDHQCPSGTWVAHPLTAKLKKRNRIHKWFRHSDCLRKIDCPVGRL